MHELVIAQDVVRAVLNEVKRQSAVGVRSIDLEVGELEGLREIDLRRAFEVEAAGTILHGARLRIKTVPANAACGACGRVVEVRPPSGRTHFMTPLTCDACGSGVTIEDGRGFVIRSAVMRLEEP